MTPHPGPVGPDGIIPVAGLTRRSEFLAVAAARRKAATPGLILQARARDAAQASETGLGIRVGFTASRKVGKAVARNRARRRLRAAAAEVLAHHAAPGTDYVLIARGATNARPFTLLTADLLAALRRLGALRKSEGGGREGGTGPDAGAGRYA